MDDGALFEGVPRYHSNDGLDKPVQSWIATPYHELDHLHRFDVDDVHDLNILRSVMVSEWDDLSGV
jgi:hypothetical protein